jgi:PhoPQ-activated pathogenicity-related protein
VETPLVKKAITLESLPQIVLVTFFFAKTKQGDDSQYHVFLSGRPTTNDDNDKTSSSSSSTTHPSSSIGEHLKENIPDFFLAGGSSQ